MLKYDFGTVRLYDAGEVIEAFFGRNDLVARNAVKNLKARFDGSRKSWKINPKFARKNQDEIAESIKRDLLADAPQKWTEIYEKMMVTTSTTKKFGIYCGAGGIRLVFPPGYRHDHTLKKLPGLAERDGFNWLIPAKSLTDKRINQVFKDTINDDKLEFIKCMEFLEGFQLKGTLSLIENEKQEIGLEVGKVVFVEPSFVRKVDAHLGNDPLIVYPVKVRSASETDEGLSVKLNFIAGEEAWKMTSRFLNPTKTAMHALDTRHLTEEWVRRRAD